jgi:hypothetical protein
LVIGGSLVVVAHLTAVVLPVLDAPSGPWGGTLGRTAAGPPAFAEASRGFYGLHAKYLRLAHSYRFVTNRPADAPAVAVEIRLRDQNGVVVRTLRLPDPDANFWVRHRQQQLASSLAPDLSVQTPGQEILAAPGGKVPSSAVWMHVNEPLGVLSPPPSSGDQSELQLRQAPQHLIPRYRPVMGPSDWAQVLARSFVRRVRREHDVASVEVVRRTRESIPPETLFAQEVPAKFEELTASFGEESR